MRTNYPARLLLFAPDSPTSTILLKSVSCGTFNATCYLFHPLPDYVLKSRVPYQSLQINVSRLQKLQQASDVLRRTSRFVILARRLQIQMAEMESGSSTPDQPLPLIRSKSDESALGQDLEDGKERTIAKAALSIAELGMFLGTSVSRTWGGTASWVSRRKTVNRMILSPEYL